MSISSFIIVDADSSRANGLCRSLSALGYAFPVSQLEEVGDAWPDRCCLVVGDEGHALADVMAFLKERSLYVPVIAYGTAPPVSRVVEALQAGALTYVDWPCSPEKLAKAVGSIGHTAEEILQAGEARERVDRRLRELTNRETEVLHKMSEGCSNKELASQLGISLRTVEVHRSKIYAKLKVRNAVEAVGLLAERRVQPAAKSL